VKYRKCSVFILICFSLLLSACGNKEEKVNVSAKVEDIDLSGYPVGMQLGNISLEYFTVLDDTQTEWLAIGENLKSTTASSSEEKKELYRKYLLYINGIKYNISNDVEKEIDNYFSSFLYNTKHWAEYRIKYLDTKSDLDNSVASDYFTDAKNDMMMVIDIMEKYQLFHE